jgi:hypothetical protein
MIVCKLSSHVSAHFIFKTQFVFDGMILCKVYSHVTVRFASDAELLFDMIMYSHVTIRFTYNHPVEQILRSARIYFIESKTDEEYFS